MGQYRCSCGFVAERTPTLGDAIVSVYHLHRAVRLDGGTAVVRMAEILDAPPQARQADPSRHVVPA